MTTPLYTPPVRAILDATFALAVRIWESREDLRVLYGTMRNPEFWIWMHWHGPTEYPELQSVFFPMPEQHLVDRVTGPGTPLQRFREGGLVDFRCILQGLLAGGFDFERGRVLDYGCGCGRILRYFAWYAAKCHFTGVDIDQHAIAWCRENLGFADFEKIEVVPPMPFPDRSFDAVFAYSVFTHLPEESHLRWLAELARLTVSGAPVVLTVHGKRAIERWVASDTPCESPTPAALAAALPELERTGFQFFRLPPMRQAHADNVEYWKTFDLELYGNTFITRDYVERRWCEHFELVAWHAAPADWQDVVVLRRRPDRG